MITSTDTPRTHGGARVELPAPRWSRVRRLQLIHREVKESLASASLEALFTYSEQVSEGGLDGGRSGAYVTVMVTIDLLRCETLFEDPVDAATAQRVIELMLEHPWIRGRLVELARPELSRLVGKSVLARAVDLEMRARADGTTILIDGDAMTALGGEQGAW